MRIIIIIRIIGVSKVDYTNFLKSIILRSLSIALTGTKKAQYIPFPEAIVLFIRLCTEECWCVSWDWKKAFRLTTIEKENGRKNRPNFLGKNSSEDIFSLDRVSAFGCEHFEYCLRTTIPRNNGKVVFGKFCFEMQHSGDSPLLANESIISHTNGKYVRVNVLGQISWLRIRLPATGDSFGFISVSFTTNLTNLCLNYY